MEDFIKAFCDRYSASYENALKVLELSTQVKIKKNDFAIKQGLCNDNMYVIKEGLLRGVRFSEKHDTTLWFASNGQAFCCPKSFAKEEISVISVQALTDCTLYRMSRKEIDHMNRIYPNLKPICINIFAELLVGVKRFRFVIIDNDNSTDRYLNFCKLRPDIYSKIPLKYVSSYLGIAQQSLSRIRATLKKQGLINEDVLKDLNKTKK
jgi:CRP-like cAMP-binding protein